MASKYGPYTVHSGVVGKRRYWVENKDGEDVLFMFNEKRVTLILDTETEAQELADKLSVSDTQYLLELYGQTALSNINYGDVLSSIQVTVNVLQGLSVLLEEGETKAWVITALGAASTALSIIEDAVFLAA